MLDIAHLQDRRRFSNSIRKKGIGEIPIIVKNLNLKLILLKIHMDKTIKDLKQQIEVTYPLYLSLDTIEMLNDNIILGDIYKTNRNEEDKILYINVYKHAPGYFTTIINYLYSSTYRFFERK